MRFYSSAFIVLLAFGVNATLCEDPFPSSIYDDARHAFADILASTRSGSENQDAVRLHKLILSGFDNPEALKLGDPVVLKRVVNTQVGRLKVSAAHIAAMMQDTDALQWLIDKGANINAKDKRGFTPAHFAALGQTKECLEFLYRNNAELGPTNEFGATPEQTWSLTHLKKSADQTLFFVDWISPQVDRLDGEHFCLFTGTYFVEGIKQTPKSVLTTWAEEFAASEIPEAKPLTERVEKFRPLAASFYLKTKFVRVPALYDLITSKDFRLHAYREFEAGDVVETYAGYWEPEKNSQVHDLFAVKTDRMQGYLPFASSEGLPNIAFVQFFNRLGLSQGHFAMAIRHIKPGDRIIRERLNIETIPDSRSETEAEALDELLKMTPLVALPMSTRAFDPEHIRDRAILRYLIDNPAVLIRLRAEEKITGADLKSFALASKLRIERNIGGVAFSFVDSTLASMERLFEKRHMRRFFASKARDGKLQGILQMFDVLLVSPETNTRSELEAIWSKHRF